MAVCRCWFVPTCVKNKITAAQPGFPSSLIHLQCLRYMSGFVREAWGGALPYVQYCCTRRWGRMLSRNTKSSWRSTSKLDREDSHATSVSEQGSMWPQSVPGWQPSCERLPPASWAVVGLGVGMMALCCAVVWCVEYSCNVPLLLVPAAVFASLKNTAIYRQPTQLSQYCRYWVIRLSMSSDLKGAIAGNPHNTQSPPQVDHCNYYTSTYRYSLYHGTLEQWR